MGKLVGLLSTSHFKLRDIPSVTGIPKPGIRVIANDGVSEIKKKPNNCNGIFNLIK